MHTINYGSFALDDGNYIIKEAEYKELKAQDPEIDIFIRPFIGAQELLHNKKAILCLVKGNFSGAHSKAPFNSPES